MVSLELIHFNDVYHVQPAKDEPVGGASRFTTKLNETREESILEDKPILLFSGDVFNPSLEGTITRGSHMPDILNEFGIAASCLGNHDFDFGMPQLEKLLRQTNFPWLLSNVLDSESPSGAKYIKRYLVIEQPQSGLRIGLIGLVEKEWIQTIPSFPPELTYYDFIQVGKDLARYLKDPNGQHRVDIVIALTHMRVPNDVKLAHECKGDIDLVLGGHDHFYYVSNAVHIAGDKWSRDINLNDVGYDPEKGHDDTPVYVVKSGTDFREFSYLKLDIETDENNKKYIKQMSAERKVVESSITPHPKTDELVQQVAELVNKKTKAPIGYTTVPLDGRSMSVRTVETNLGNLTADLMMMYHRTLKTPAEIGFCVGGTIRNDSIIEAGEITLGDIMTAFPFLDPVVVIRVTGKQLWDALENSVSEYPKQEGRFPQLSGVRLEWNPEKPPGQRVHKVYTFRNHGRSIPNLERRRSLTFPHMENRKASYDPENMDELDMDREYIVATRNYLIGGYDGYTAFKVPEDKIIVDEENGVLVSTLYRKFFLGLKYINAFREYQAKKSVHRTKEENEERIKNLVVSAANHWRGIARQFKRHDHPDDGRDCHCVQNTQDTEIYLSSDISDRANYHCTSQSITNAFTDASRGHPSCIEAEDDENVDNYTYNENSDLTWVKRWASIAPQVEGRITRVDY